MSLWLELHVKSFLLFFCHSAELFWWHVSWIHIFSLFRFSYCHSYICYVFDFWFLKAGLVCSVFTWWELFLNETCPQTEQNMAILEAWIMLMITSHERVPSHEQLAFIRLKQAIYDKFRPLRMFVESNIGFSYFPLIALCKNKYKWKTAVTVYKEWPTNHHPSILRGCLKLTNPLCWS